MDLPVPGVQPRLPAPRGALSSALLDCLGGARATPPEPPPAQGGDPLDDEDLQLALYVCYELHYRGFLGVDPCWEWDPSLLGFRRVLERRFEQALARDVPVPEAVPAEGLPTALRALTNRAGPPLSAFLEQEATLAQFLEFVIHRSAYQRKEADPHSWALPRLEGAAKAALVEIQADEYGGGRPERMHQELFAATMAALGLDPAYGAYLDAIPATTLATVNLVSLFGLHRRWRGALVGHLAAFEMTSTEPNRRFGNGLRRLGFGAEATTFYDEHVQADSVHEQVAAHDLAGGLARQEPALVSDILFGAEACLHLDDRAAGHLLGAWTRGESSLRWVEGPPGAG
ncbi:MAG TPA: iron-containing redox enzyme family protein [Actinomycetota bacterium]|nr:iron-containing redox enzyme family protein [Actinomycetota bacterium]